MIMTSLLYIMYMCYLPIDHIAAFSLHACIIIVPRVTPTGSKPPPQDRVEDTEQEDTERADTESACAHARVCVCVCVCVIDDAKQ